MEYQVNAAYNEAAGVWEVTLQGEVDIFNSNAFRDELIARVTEKPAGLVMDCAELKYIDSTGLGALVAVLKHVKTCGGTITLRSLRPNLAKLFKITSLDKTFIMDGDSHE